MDWDTISLVAIITAMVLFSGFILLIVHHLLKQSRDRAMMRFISRDMTCRTKKIVLEAMREAMDIIPEKLMQAKNVLEGERYE